MPGDLRAVIFGVLLVHGLGHGGALGALLWLARWPGSTTGGWQAARSWVLPGIEPSTATAVAGAFWILSLVGFVAAALAFWELVLPNEVWRPVAVLAAIVSLAGIVLFLGTWPTFNTLAAIGVNLAVLVTQVWMRWPSDVAIAR